MPKPVKHDSECTITGLKRRARKISEAKYHHKLLPWQMNSYTGNSHYHAMCLCGVSVTVTTKPQANETYISGSAVVLTCTREDTC